MGAPSRSGVRFALLGPLRAWRDDARLALGPVQQRVVLAVLLLHANRPVGREQLIDAVWGQAPPKYAVNLLQKHVSALRRILDPERAARTASESLVWTDAGYLLTVPPGALDLDRYDHALSVAGSARAAGDLPAAARAWHDALLLWRGPLCDGLTSPFLDAQRDRLGEQRLGITEQRIDADLALSRHAEVIPELRDLVAGHPLRERLRELLMLALYRSGRRADALAAYQEARQRLREELGVEPAAPLQRLHRQILSADAGLAAPATARVIDPARGERPVPRELPATVAHFVGRTDEAARARDALIPTVPTGRHRAAVVVFHGPGGSGKSTLAVHVAHEVADGFPDGQLYIDLQGSTPGLRPLATLEVLQRMLRGLGVPAGDIPHDAGDAARRFRTETANRRLLIVLDNANDAGPLVALLPASGASAVLVTSRHPLGTLDADRRIRLGGLAVGEGQALLVRLADNDAIDEAGSRRIVELCDHLPLALRIVAGRLTGLSAASLDDFAQRLADRRRRLDELELEGLAVRSSIAVSYDALAHGPDRRPRLAARVFRLLGLLNVPEFQPEVVATMLGDRDLMAARVALDHLVSAGLLEPLPRSRYRLHDLVRLVAAERAADEEESGACAAALHRGLAYYAGGLWRADRLMKPGRVLPLGEPPTSPDVVLPTVTTALEAKEWVRAEFHCLVAAVEQANGLDSESRRFASFIGEALWDHLYRRQDMATASRLAWQTLEAAERHDDREAASWAHLTVGRTAAELCQWSTAVEHLERTLSTQSELGNHEGVAVALNSLAVVAELQGDLPTARRYLSECRKLARRFDMPGLEGVVLLNFSTIYAVLGRWDEAAESAERGLAIRRKLRNSMGTSICLRSLATVRCCRGDAPAAVRYADEALSLSREDGDQMGEHYCLLTRSEAYRRSGEHAGALADSETALALARRRGDRYTESLALHQKSRVVEAMGEVESARRLRSEADDVRAAVRTRLDPLMETLLQPATAVATTVAAPADPQRRSRRPATAARPVA